MIDHSVSLLIQALASHPEENILVIADENWANAPWGSIHQAASVFCNRFDITQAALKAGVDAHFNDFDFSSLAQGSINAIFYRVSKERPVSHHVLNAASQYMAPGGNLYLSGEKPDGIKTYAKHAATMLDSKAHINKQGNSYLVSITKVSTGEPLDDKQYRELRPIPEKTAGQISEKQTITFYSKPGIFGWNKIDQGSALLIDHLENFLQRFKKQPLSLLDLGCGYGYIACIAARQGFKEITATDNNAAAITATAYNFEQLNIPGEVIADDAGNALNRHFDTILCNPPFHQGFSIEGDLTDKFLSATQRLLSPTGKALFVVNSFIPLEKKATGYFSSVDTLENNGSFKLIELSG